MLWCKKLQISASCGLAEVVTEQRALLCRDELMHLSRVGDAKGVSRNKFWELLDKFHAEFDNLRCAAVLKKSAQRALSPVLFSREPAFEQYVWTRNVFWVCVPRRISRLLAGLELPSPQ